MISPYKELAARIRGEISDLDRLIVKVVWAWEQCKTNHLSPGKVEPVISKIPQIWPNLQDELLAFADFLEQI